jgi:hypothetical protein
MPLKQQMFVVQGWGYTPADADAHPEHPIYIPVDPPPDSGLAPEHPIYVPVYPAHPIAPGGEHPAHPIAPGGEQPEHPIYLPVDPPPDSGLSPEHPIYIPVYPAHPIVLPPPVDELPPEQAQKLKEFLLGNLPPFDAPDYVQPVRR